MLKFENIRIGFALCGSFCTFSRAFEVLERLKAEGADVYPIMSFNAYSLNTRFGEAETHNKYIEAVSGHKIIHTIEDAEPIGPQKMLDILLVANCTGNTLAKLANSITDSPVTMAVKSHIRNSRPVVLSIATNDALAGAGKNIAALMNFKNYFFVPMRQDDAEKKPTSLMTDFSLTEKALLSALDGKQLQPMLV